jgi:MerR family transcriptional regulator, light-induced transcriptional regulator
VQHFNSELFLTTSEVAELLGVHPSTVKRWTDAGELPSEKTDGGHRRIYLHEVLDFAGVRGNGTYLDAFAPFQAHVWLAVRDALRENEFRKVVSLAVGWLLRGYPRRITALFHLLASRPDLPLARFVDGAVQPFMEEVGTSWREGRLRIGEEHMASQAVFEALIRRSAEIAGPQETARSDALGRPVALVGAMSGDQHHMGAMCIRLLLEARGFDVKYLGADTPADEFAALQRSLGAELVCVSFSPPASAGQMRRCLEVLVEFHRDRQPYDLAFGGRATPLVDAEAEDGLPFRRFGIFHAAGDFEAWLDGRPAMPRIPAAGVSAGSGADAEARVAMPLRETA